MKHKREDMRFKAKRYAIGCLLLTLLFTTLKLYISFYDPEYPENSFNFALKDTIPSLKYFNKKTSDKRIRLQELVAKGTRYSSTTCQFPRLSIYNDANKDAFEKMEPLVCSDGNDLFYLDNGIVRLNQSVLKSSEEKKLQNCEYLAVERVSDDYFTFTEPVVKKESPFDLIIHHDFIRIKCNLVDPEDEAVKSKFNENKEIHKNTSQNNYLNDKGDNPNFELYQQYDALRFDQYMDGMGIENLDFDQFLVQVYPKPEVLKRTSIVPLDNGTGLNVLIIGLDSLSHLSFQRLLPETYRLLRDELDFTILNGYNIVGDGTTAALIPILTGKTEMELPEVRKDEIDSKNVDSYPLIWKKFKDHGYATLFAEDEPSINTFNLRLNGFEQQPTDHYMRPFWQALWQSTLQDISSKYCTGHIPHHKYLLGYIKDFFIKYKNMPKFSFLFMGELTHWRNDPGQYLDSDFVSYLKWLKHSGELEKSVVIVMADHGARYGKVRKTVQGKIEERMPMMSIRYPVEFLKKYPKVLTNLKLNKERLTAPFDIYETITDVLDKHRFSEAISKKQRGISLSHEVPFDRTCSDAGIDIHWCSCLVRIKQDIKNEYVQKAAREIVSYINKMTFPLRKYCRNLELQDIKSAYVMIPNEKVLKFVNNKDDDFRYANYSREAMLDIVHLDVTVATLPQNGLFEATVVVNFKDDSVKLNPGLSRLDRYGEQSACIQKRYPDLLKYCLCKDLKIK